MPPAAWRRIRCWPGLTPTIRQFDLPLDPFRRLIEANRRDQVVRRYQTFDDLIGYCMLSAAPVGELVLRIFEVSSPDRIALSDDVCNGLQIVEHIQDVAEDIARDRVYLPLDDLTSLGCSEAELRAPRTSPALRAVLRYEAGRARRLLGSAVPLARQLPLQPRMAVCGFAAGGLAALDAIERAGYEVLAPTLPPPAAPPGAPPGKERAGGLDEAGRMNTDTAYRACEEITRREAKNFGYGIRLLRVPERQALSSVYALARRIDDIGDGTAPPAQKLVELAQVRESLHPIPPDTEDPVLVAVAAATRQYHLPLAAFDELIDGCERDVRGTSYATFDDLVVYCRLVAGSIGRLSLAVFGTTDPKERSSWPTTSGVALQLTNILRDVLEDRANGRVYLPAADADGRGLPGRPLGKRHGAGRSGGLRVRPGARVVRAGTAAPPPPQSPEPCLCRRHGRHLPPPPRPHRAGSHGGDPAPALAARGGKGLDRRKVHRRGPGVSPPPGGRDRWRAVRDQRRPHPGGCRCRRSRCSRGGRGSEGSPGPSGATACHSTMGSMCSCAAVRPISNSSSA